MRNALTAINRGVQLKTNLLNYFLPGKKLSKVFLVTE